jgi:integrase
MACIRKRRGKWVVDYYDGIGENRTRRWITCRTRDQAKAALAKALRESGQPLNDSVDSNITVAEYARKWLEQLRASDRKARTLEVYASTLNQHVLPAFGNTRLRKIGRGALKDVLVSKLEAGFARDSVRAILSTMRSLLSDAVEDGVIAVNPAAGLGRKLRLTIPPQQRQEQIKAMTAEQLTAFVSAAKRVPLSYGALLWTLSFTGMRFGEGLGLQWNDVDFEKQEIHVQRALSNGHLTTPKAGHGRRVAMGAALSRMLVRLRMHRAEQMKRYRWTEIPAWVFATRSGGPAEPNRLRRFFRKCLKAAGLSSHFTPHSLRHTFASILLQRGEAPQWLMQQLGYASITLTVDTYGRWLPKKPIRGGVTLLETLTGSNVVAKKPEMAGREGGLLRFDARFAQCRASYSPSVT